MKKLRGEWDDYGRPPAIKEEEFSERRAIPSNMINCFCMYSDYTPLTLDEWIFCDRKRREKLCAEGSM